jgi:hypothetical protein
MNKLSKFLYRNIVVIGLMLIVAVTAAYALANRKDDRPDCGCATTSHSGAPIPIRTDTPIQQVPADPQNTQSSGLQSGAAAPAEPTSPRCNICSPKADTVCPESIACPEDTNY